MAVRKLIYDVNDRPKLKNLFLYSFQMLLAILAATVAVPTIIGLPSQIPSAILGAGVGTLVYIFFTKGKSPIIVSSSFAFLAAFPAAIAFGYMGILVGGLFAGLIYLIIAIIVKFAGTRWVNRLMPAVIIGPIVALIGLNLAPNAISDLVAANSSDPFAKYNFVAILCGLVTLFTIVICTVQNRFKGVKLIPFIIGIGAGYLLASIFTGIGLATNVGYLKIINWDNLVNSFSPVTINSFFSVPHISLIEGIKELTTGEFSSEIIHVNEALGIQPTVLNGVGIAKIALAFCPLSLVTFAEHLADHKNISTIIGHDLINDEPGLHRTLLGDGFGTMLGTAFGVCPNTSYGESIACVALTRNASVITTFTTACICILLSFLAPFSNLLQTIPKCVMGGVCLALYGYISVSGLKMFKEVDLDDNANLLTVCTILISGIGGFALQIPYQINNDPEACSYIIIGAIATSLLLGIAVYQVARHIHKREKSTAADIVSNLPSEDYVRMYLKQFSTDKIAKGVLMFGFLHESVDASAMQLSNILHNEEILNLRTKEELTLIIKMYKFKGYSPTLNKKQLIKLIIDNCHQIEQDTIRPVTGATVFK